MFYRHGKNLDKRLAGIMMSGIISDTLNLQSPTSTDKDRDVLNWLSDMSGTPIRKLAEIIFASGSVVLSAESMEEVVRSDMKRYDEGGISFTVSQVEELGFDNFWKHEEALAEAVGQLQSDEQSLFSALLVTDINSQNSLLLIRGSEEFIQQINYPRKGKSEVFDMPGIVSRKKQLIPFLTSSLKSAGLMDAPAAV